MCPCIRASMHPCIDALMDGRIDGQIDERNGVLDKVTPFVLMVWAIGDWGNGGRTGSEGKGTSHCSQPSLLAISHGAFCDTLSRLTCACLHACA